MSPAAAPRKGVATDPRTDQICGDDLASVTFGGNHAIYEVDATVRRAQALQLTEDGIAGQAWRGSLNGDAS